MKSLKLTLILVFIYSLLVAQSDVLDKYIETGIANNEAIKQQNFQLEKSMYALKETTGLFFPNINLQANYVDSRGGRTIDFPIGDIMNPVFKNLNAINTALGAGPQPYPTLQNVSEQLNPKNFYDASFKFSLPLINAEIWYNRHIRKEEVALQQAGVIIYKRELVKDIKTAYFNYLKSVQAVRIYENALVLVKESERVNQKLVDNGKEVVYAVSRSKSEVSKIEAQLTEAKNTQKNAAAYFNFLLNQPLEADITIDESLLTNLLPLPGTGTGNASKREELTKLMVAQNIDQSLVNLSKSAWIPKVGASLNLGSQSSDFKFNDKSRYYLVGVSFDWNLFSGLRDVYHIKQAKLEQQSTDAQYKYVESQLKLASVSASNSFASAREQYNSAVDQENASNQYFTLMNKRYREGQALYIEYLDARNENTQASLQKSLKYFDAWIKLADMERANASFEIK